MIRWIKGLFSKPEALEEVYVPYGGAHHRCSVQYDADGRPFVMLFGSILRLDQPTGKDIVWIKRKVY